MRKLLLKISLFNFLAVLLLLLCIKNYLFESSDFETYKDKPFKNSQYLDNSKYSKLMTDLLEDKIQFKNVKEEPTQIKN